jgi:hypothetical protein
MAAAFAADTSPIQGARCTPPLRLTARKVRNVNGCACELTVKQQLQIARSALMAPQAVMSAYDNIPVCSPDATGADSDEISPPRFSRAMSLTDHDSVSQTDLNASNPVPPRSAPSNEVLQSEADHPMADALSTPSSKRIKFDNAMEAESPMGREPQTAAAHSPDAMATDEQPLATSNHVSDAGQLTGEPVEALLLPDDCAGNGPEQPPSAEALSWPERPAAADVSPRTSSSKASMRIACCPSLWSSCAVLRTCVFSAQRPNCIHVFIRGKRSVDGRGLGRKAA